jgi:zinc transport system permease protein
LFIVLLALIVNLCLNAVGALLINALLIVPAATASNLAGNLRQMFWLTVALSLAAGIGGFWLSSVVEIDVGGRQPLSFGTAGTIVVLSVALFFLSMAVPPLLKRILRRGRHRPDPDRAGGPLPLSPVDGARQ